jgi:hypothetical protein
MQAIPMQDKPKQETKSEESQLAQRKSPLPLVPTNLDEAWRISQTLAESSLLPEQYRGKPANVLAAFYMAADLGISGMQAMREIYVVKGKPGSSSALKTALVRQSPDCLMWELVESTPLKATFKTQRRGDAKPTVLTFTIEQAKTAGLYPGKPDSAWNSYPENMLRARAASFLADLVYPDVVKGLKTKEELDEVDAGEREIPGERIFSETMAPPAPVVVPQKAAVVTVEAPKAVPSEEPRAPAPAAPEREPGSDDGAPDPIDVFLQELEQVGSAKDIDGMSKRVNTIAPKGHARRDEIGTAIAIARRRVQQ